MEEGQTYNTEIDVIGTCYKVSATPFPQGEEWRFKVTIQPGNINTVFQYAQTEERDGLASATAGIVPEPLESAIADWLEREED